MKKYLTLKNLGFALTFVASFLLVKQGIPKIIQTEEMINNFTYLKLLPFLTLVGVLEIAAAVLLLINKTSIYGAALVGSIMSAAVAVHLSVIGGGALVPLIIGLSAWTGYFLRTYPKDNA
jgi:hypothetical protein